MLVISVDRDSDRPVWMQVADEIRRRISDGFLPAGSRLPSSRDLSERCKLGRNTVIAAYEALLDEGWLSAGVGRGTFVAPRPTNGSNEAAGVLGPTKRRSRSVAWDALFARRCDPRLSQATLAQAHETGGELYRFAGAVPDAAYYPAAEIGRIMHGLLKRVGPDALGYGPPEGFLPLRETIAKRATEQGTPVQPDDVLIVNGSQQGLDLLARLLLAPGDVVAVERPTYANATELWRLYGARVVSVSMDEGGIRPEELEVVIARSRPKFCYLMPTFQNPTGLTMEPARRREVMNVLTSSHVPTIEDHFDSDLRYTGVPLAPLRALDYADDVIVVGSFSKILFPGFRLGWIIAPKAVRDRLLEIKQTCDLTTSLPAQMAVHEFCARGGLDRHLDVVREENARRLEAMIDAVLRCFPPNVGFTRPDGGMTIWITLPERADSTMVFRRARTRGVLVAPGPWFFPDGGGERHLRLSFVGETPDRIRSGMRILGEVMAEHLAERRAPVREGRDRAPFV
jgi:DNA-binding transcriptional MocR family regulator